MSKINKRNRSIVVGMTKKSLAVAGVLFTVIRILALFFPDCGFSDPIWFFSIVAISIACGVRLAWPCSTIEVSLPSTNSKLKIKFGDLFENDGVIVIPVNEFFDYEIGDIVGENTLHGQFILKVLKGDGEEFKRLVSESLRDEPSIAIIRKDGTKNRFDIGTVARIKWGAQTYLLAALSHTEPNSYKASATTLEFTKCLRGVWDAARIHSQGTCVVIPLIGSGLSNIGLPAEHLIQIIHSSFLESSKERQVTCKLVLVLPDRYRSEINLNILKERWS